ncbi:MAG: hypothetical protein GY868_17740 [Deltaproteobacteria bacterium]|nr:hypothetical protein [Deltaproteobacteria bacterium]
MNVLLDEQGKLPKLEVYQTNDEFKDLADRSLDNREKAIYYMGSVENLAAVFDEDYDRGTYIPTRTERGIYLKMLIPENPAMIEYQSRDGQEHRETRFLRPELMMDNSIMIYDDTVIYFSDARESYALSITSSSIAKSMKVIFDDLWNNTQGKI